MTDRLQASVYVVVLLLIVGWLLFIGRVVFVPIVFGAIAVYVIVDFTRLLARIPGIGKRMPVQLRYGLSIFLIAAAIFFAVDMLVANYDALVALAPRYQDSVLAMIQKIATLLHLESEPTWESLRRNILAQLNIQAVVTGMLASLSSVIIDIFVVLLYASFLLVERGTFSEKLTRMSANSSNAARIRSVVIDINRRIGAYLALKTFLGVVLGAICWLAMRSVGLEFAGLWAVITALLNYVPYIGSVLAIVFPVLMSVLQFGDVNSILIVLLTLTAIHFVIGNILDPYLMGNSLNLSPFAILASMAVWSALWGVPGAFLAVPITVSMTIIFSEFEMTRPVAVLLSKNGRLSYGKGEQTA
ncbi:AI-2E family transporter [Burkholderia sp. SRS-W-2-2016]|uniref:AI-2E family transporter n=1 Tax=Burkholderia sp. SRS-W-2-2016 TaxID=1926878 RepID=UPI00094B2EEB|nr:AI-2E family transporter [Burkholderia sp. SRS-W-2-2016]OLL27732.1 AI-2E family transporter [Burkholderia sp. SRS-W-2-2016]